MLKLGKQYRLNYKGEEVITERKKEFQHWTQTVENVPNAVDNNQISNRAVVIGNSAGRKEFNLNLLKTSPDLQKDETLFSSNNRLFPVFLFYGIRLSTTPERYKLKVLSLFLDSL